MQWSEEGIVLGARRHGETAVVLELLTPRHGRSLGLVRGGRSRALRVVLQPGNSVLATWRARLEEHLGLYVVEPGTLRAAGLIDSPFKLAGLTTMMALSGLLPEREPHPRLYEATFLVLERLTDDAIWPALLVRWELGLLEELGFGLDLARCAATGTTEALCYVSPRTGRAVSNGAGEAYRDKLLRLPGFLLDAARTPDRAQVRDGFALTGHFLERHLLAPRGLAMPEARSRILARLP
ncbi:MAG: DNA repair protein RecO [Pseudomonadota bacterium]|nr:DNA repair protein RecO [Pseudomonadota bacterium]